MTTEANPDRGAEGEPIKEGAAAPAEGAVQTPEQLHDAAIAATEAWQENPGDEKLKEAAKTATKAAKESLGKQKAATEAALGKGKAPDKYDLKLPADSVLEASHVEKIAAFAKERGLSNEQAQAILNRDSEQASAFHGSQLALVDRQRKEWLDTSKADKEFGGEAFPANVELANRVIARYGSDTLRSQLDETGLGNHPEFLRMMVKLGKSMDEDHLRLPGKGAEGEKNQSVADRLFPTTAGQT